MSRLSLRRGAMGLRCPCWAGSFVALIKHEMNQHRSAVSLLAILCVPVLFGCAIVPFLSPPVAGTPAPIALQRCSNYPSALCLDSFGLGEGQLLITFYFPAATSSDFFLKVWQASAVTTYPCTLADAAPTMMYCTGPVIDLGTPIKIDLYTKTGKVPLAEGEFTLNGLAVPTAGGGTPIAGTVSTPTELASPTLNSGTTMTPTATATPQATAYSNPAYP